ncbi:50S ribosomal protein L33 [Candidatus Azambacteria bacterium]|nr:50S ribosomal protein L33 [Candidatus Azambacteria bacterium]
MAQENIVKMQCPSCKNTNYWTHKNKKTMTTKLALAKFCKACRKHVTHKEAKK